MLHNYDDKLKAFNAIENWCFVLITNIVLWRILLFFNRIVFDIRYFYRRFLVYANDMTRLAN
jgi:hypothetical protein